MAEIRQRGFADEEQPDCDGSERRATPVLGGGASLQGVLCVSHLCRKDELGEHADIVQAVVECARSISAEFGPLPKDQLELRLPSDK